MILSLHTCDIWWRSLSLQCCEWCFDLTPTWSILSLFFFPPSLSFLFPHCHWNSSFSFKSYCISLVSINLTLSLCLPFRFSTPPHACIHLVATLSPSPPWSPLNPPPPPTARLPLWYSQSHLQSDIFNGLITLSSHGLIEHLTSAPHLLRPLTLPFHLRPLT